MSPTSQYPAPAFSPNHVLFKQFRFLEPDEMCAEYSPNTDLQAMSMFYDYTEPFSAECRAFGRLHETGREDLAIKCYGYVLLDEAHEKALKERFRDHPHVREKDLTFNGRNVALYHQQQGFFDEVDEPDDVDWRRSYVPRDRRLPPIRGILKELGTQWFVDGRLDFRKRDMTRLFRQIKQLHQLGIYRLDLRVGEQLIDGKFADLSVAATLPSYEASPELNPLLTRRDRLQLQTNLIDTCGLDYYRLDRLVLEFNGILRRRIEAKMRNSAAEYQAEYGPDTLTIAQMRKKKFTKPFLETNPGSQRRRKPDVDEGGTPPWTWVDPRRYDSVNPRRLPPIPPALVIPWSEYEGFEESIQYWRYEDGYIFPGPGPHVPDIKDVPNEWTLFSARAQESADN